MTTVSSFTTYSSLAMAQIEIPVPAERMAVLEMRELPGSESMIDCALLLGSSEGTFEANRAWLRVIEEVGSARAMVEGRSGRAPVALSQCFSTMEGREVYLPMALRINLDDMTERPIDGIDHQIDVSLRFGKLEVGLGALAAREPDWPDEFCISTSSKPRTMK